MSNCDQNCEAVANLNDYAANLIEYSKRIDKWVNGGQTEFVDVGGVSTPTLRNLAMSIKALMGIHPDNKTIFINQDKEIYVKLSALIKSGGGLNLDTDGKLFVDVDSMNTEVFEKLLQTLRLPIWLDGNMNFYVNFATGSDTLDEGRGITAAKPFKTIQACIDYLTINYNINIYRAIINVANGTYPAFEAKSYQRTSGEVVINGQSKNGVIIKNVDKDGQPTINTVLISGGKWLLQNLTIESYSTGTASDTREIFTINATTNSDAYLYNCAVKVYQGIVPAALTNIYCLIGGNRATIYIREGCSISANVSNGASIIRGICATSYGNIILQWETTIGPELNITGSYERVVNVKEHGSVTRMQIQLSGITGTATGQRYNCYDGGSINTYGGGQNYFPGSEEGQVQSASYSYYL